MAIRGEAQSNHDDLFPNHVSDLVMTKIVNVLILGANGQDGAIDYRTTQKGKPFQGHDVSLDSVSDLIVKLALSPTMEVRRSLGVSSG
jgi:hypothetical protein